jgi:hypothetical protein
MDRRKVAVGEKWAYREKPYTVGNTLVPVEVLRLGPPRSNKVRVRFLEGEENGLEIWVPIIRLRLAAVVGLLQPYSADLVEAYPVGTLVNNARHDGPALIRQFA